MIDFCITHFIRTEGLIRLLESINKYYPKAKITIANQGEPFELPGCKVINLPFDCGLSRARNELVKKTKEPYFLLLEDDFYFNDFTNINSMLKLMDLGAGVVGGMVKEFNQEVHFEHYLEIEDKTLYHKKDGDNYQFYKGAKYKETGCVLNFALFNRKSLIEWDEDLKIDEHQDFYLRFKDKVIYTPSVMISTRKNVNTRAYKEMRKRDEFKKRFFEKWGIDRIVYLNGRVYEYNNNQIKKSYAKTNLR